MVGVGVRHMWDVPITLKLTCPGLPFQVEGTIAGFPFYFRERHGHWNFGIALVQDGSVHPADAAFGLGTNIYFEHKDYIEGQDHWSILFQAIANACAGLRLGE